MRQEYLRQENAEWRGSTRGPDCGWICRQYMAHFHRLGFGKIPMFQWLFRVCRIVLLALGLGAASAEEKEHKLRVSDPEVAAQIAREGGELIADYGAFQLFRVEEKTAARIAGQGKAEDLSHQNSIELNAGALDTGSDEVKALRKAVAPGSGKNLHLVQFA